MNPNFLVYKKNTRVTQCVLGDCLMHSSSTTSVCVLEGGVSSETFDAIFLCFKGLGIVSSCWVATQDKLYWAHGEGGGEICEAAGWQTGGL
jgi:hypothetical protein